MSQIPSAASIAARRSRDRYERCPYCPSTGVTGTHVDRCADVARYRKAAVTAGDAAGVPEVVVLDLWSHARTRLSSELYATEMVQVMLDLGWRPVIGHGEVEWAVVADGRVIHIADAACPADVLAGAHGHGTHGPLGVAHRTVTRTPWQHLTDTPKETHDGP